MNRMIGMWTFSLVLVALMAILSVLFFVVQVALRSNQ